MKYTLKWKVLNFIEIWSRDINIWAYKHCNKEGDRMLKNRRDRENDNNKKEETKEDARPIHQN